MMYLKIRYCRFAVSCEANSQVSVCVYIHGNDFGSIDLVELELLDFKKRTSDTKHVWWARQGDFLACKKMYLANKAFLILKWVLPEELVRVEPEAGMSECESSPVVWVL